MTEIDFELEETWATAMRNTLKDAMVTFINTHEHQIDMRAGMAGVVAFAVGAIKMHHILLNGTTETLELVIAQLAEGLRAPSKPVIEL